MSREVATTLGGHPITVIIEENGNIFPADSAVSVPKGRYQFVDSCELEPAPTEHIEIPAAPEVSPNAPMSPMEIPKSVIASLLPCDEPGHYPCPDFEMKPVETVQDGTNKVPVYFGAADDPDMEGELILDFNIETRCCCEAEGDTDKVEITPRLGWHMTSGPRSSRWVPVIGTYGPPANTVTIPNLYAFQYPGNWPLTYINAQEDRREYEEGDLVSGLMDTEDPDKTVYTGFFFSCSENTILTVTGNALGMGTHEDRPIFPTDLLLGSEVGSWLSTASVETLDTVGDFIAVDADRWKIRGSAEDITHSGWNTRSAFYRYTYDGKYCIARKTLRGIQLHDTVGNTYSEVPCATSTGEHDESTSWFHGNYANLFKTAYCNTVSPVPSGVKWWMGSYYGTVDNNGWYSTDELAATPGSSMVFHRCSDASQTLTLSYYKPRWECSMEYGTYTGVDGESGSIDFLQEDAGTRKVWMVSPGVLT